MQIITVIELTDIKTCCLP